MYVPALGEEGSEHDCPRSLQNLATKVCFGHGALNGDWLAIILISIIACYITTEGEFRQCPLGVADVQHHTTSAIRIERTMPTAASPPITSPPAMHEPKMLAPVTNPTERRPVSRSKEIENAYTMDESSGNAYSVQAAHVQLTYQTSCAISFAPSSPKQFSDTSSSVIVCTCTTVGDTRSA